MLFIGISRVFSTVNNQQYKEIGDFWDELSCRYSRDNLRGFGYNWVDDSIEYVIGLKDGVIQGANCTVNLQDSDWVSVVGKIASLDKLYEQIYKEGVLLFEIKTFDDEGNCITVSENRREV